MTNESIRIRCTDTAFRLLTSQQPLHPDIRKEFSHWGEDALAPLVFCGNIMKIQYDPSKIADGSPVYFNNATGALIARCDNPMATILHGERVRCPPVQWTCPG